MNSTNNNYSALPKKHKTILFLSALDFKEKSIQVIKKTPEAYAQAGWIVHYVVTRSTTDDYSYERIINPQDVNVVRITRSPGAKSKVRAIQFAKSKVQRLIDSIILAQNARRIIRKHKPDIIYGYEVYGVLAAMILKYIYRTKSPKFVSRFQGTHLHHYIQQRNIIRLLSNCEHILAMMLNADLCIMTNDGTNGDKLLRSIKSPNIKNLRFWTNGVDEKVHPHVTSDQLRQEYGIHKASIILLSVSRLVRWKRVDRGLTIAHYLIKQLGFKDLVYWIVGDGPEKASLMQLAKKLDISNNVQFLGAVNHDKVWQYFRMSDVFISMYDSSNVGNPLLEAIREHKIIVTLNNGDTGNWITHNKNGLIYDITPNTIAHAAEDIARVISNKALRKSLELGIIATEKRLWSWEERLAAEVEAVDHLLTPYEL